MDFRCTDRILPTYYKSFIGNSTVGYRLSPVMTLSNRCIEALHQHEYFEIGICTSGSGTVQLGNRVYRFSKGDIQWVRPFEPHMNASDNGVVSQWQWIYFFPSRIFSAVGMSHCDLLSGLERYNFSGVFHPSEYAELTERIFGFAETLSVDRADGFFELELALNMGRLLLAAARVAEITAPEVKPHSSKIRSALKLISNGYTDKLAMNEHNLAEKCGISVSYLRLLFKRETGMSPRSFIRQTRLSAAVYLLTDTDKSILEIANECGFEESSSFYHTFHSFFGMSPRDFRKSRAQW